jgi:hypothetical protein
MDKGRYLYAPQTGPEQTGNEIQLALGGEENLLGLQSVPGADFDQRYMPGIMHGFFQQAKLT